MPVMFQIGSLQGLLLKFDFISHLSGLVLLSISDPFYFSGISYFELNVQTVKCGDYFQAEDGPREFGNICIVTKWIQSTDTSLVLRNLEVNYKEVRCLIFM